MPFEKDMNVLQPETMIQVLKNHPRVQQIRYPAGQILLYEGHYAPGHFLFLLGNIELNSVELEEQIDLVISPDNKSPSNGWKRTSNSLLEVPNPTPTLQHFPFRLIPDAKQIALCFPYTLTIQTASELLYIPRSLCLDPAISDSLHGLTLMQENDFFR